MYAILGSFLFRAGETAIFSGSGSSFFFKRLRLQGAKNIRLLTLC